MGLYAHIVGKLAVRLHYRKKLDIYSLCSIHEPELWARGQRKAKIPASVRWEVWKRDNFTCRYCDAWGNHLTLDHIVPETHGGVNIASNLITACSSCNRHKSSTSYEEFIKSSWLKRKRRHISIMKAKQIKTGQEKSSGSTSSVGLARNAVSQSLWSLSKKRP